MSEPGAPCSRCLALAHWGPLRKEAIMPLRGGARDALARDDAGTHCCIDCEQADLLIQVSGGLDFGMARIAVANARQEHLRLPSLPPAYGLGVPLKDSTRTLDEHHAWLDVAVPHWSELGWPDDE